MFVGRGGPPGARLAAPAGAGAGAVGDLGGCAWGPAGRGGSRPRPGANPAVGDVGELVTIEEDRCELVIPTGRRDQVIAALRAAHPYEEPAFHVIQTAPLD